MRGWLELPVMEEPREGLSFWSVTGKTLGVHSQGDQSHLAFLLKGPLGGVRPPWQTEIMCATASEKELQGQDSQGHTWSRGGQKGGLQQEVWSRGGASKYPSRQNRKRHQLPRKVFLLLSFLPHPPLQPDSEQAVAVHWRAEERGEE